MNRTRSEEQNEAGNEAVKKTGNEAVNEGRNETVQAETEAKQKVNQKAKQEANQEAARKAVSEYMREKEEQQRAEELARTLHKTRFTGQPLMLACSRWTADDNGVVKVDDKGRRMTACPHPILPVERLVNLESGTEKVKLAFRRDGAWKQVVVDCTMCNSRQNILALANHGVMVNSENAKYLVQYLFDMQAENEAVIPVTRSVSHLGWQGSAFIPYSDTIQFDGGSEYTRLAKAVHTNGDRDASLAYLQELRENNAVRLILDASLASVLLEKLGAQPFTVHIWGPTGLGKTVALKLAASIWGDAANGALVQSMNTTINAMMQNAGILRNIPFFADEMQQIKRKNGNYDTFIMCFTEAINRARAKAGGGVEQLTTWHNCMISTGEEPLTRADSGGGAKNRVIELEIVEELFASGYEVSRFAEGHYGWLGKAFTEEVLTYSEAHLKELYRMKVEEVLALQHTTEKQAAAMGALLLADAMAAGEFFPGETPLGASDVAEYLPNPDCVDIASRAFEYIIGVIAANQNRFFASDNHGEIWGRIVDGHVLILKTVLERLLREGGFEYDAVSRRWAERAYLIRASDGRFNHRTSVYGIKANYIRLNLDVEGDGLGILADRIPPPAFPNAEQMQISA